MEEYYKRLAMYEDPRVLVMRTCGENANDAELHGELYVSLYGAIQLGDIDSLKALKSVEYAEFKHHLQTNGGALIFEAVRQGHFDVADFLLCNGCSTDRGRGMSTVLHLAALNREASEFLERLLYYVQPDVTDIRYNTALHVACSSDAPKNIGILLSSGANINALNVDEQTALDIAVEKGHVECSKILLEHNANVHGRYPPRFDSSTILLDHTKTPLDVAIVSLFKVLSHKYVLLALSAFLKWDQPKADEIFEKIMSAIPCIQLAENSCDPSAIKSRLRIIDLLIEKGTKFDILRSCTKHLSVNFVQEAVEFLIGKCLVDVNSRDHLHFSPLHFAVDRCSFDTVEYFIDRGALVDPMSEDGVSPLEIALRKKAVDVSVVRLLVGNGARLNYFKPNGWSPLTAALNNIDAALAVNLAEMMLDAGADPNIKDDRGLSAISHLVSLKISQSYFDLKSLKCLLDHGADVNIRDNTGATPLHIAASNISSRYFLGEEVMRLLLRHTKNVNALDSSHCTPLIRAVSVPFHSCTVVRQLLEAGADPNIEDDSGESPLKLAISTKKVDVVTVLVEYDVDFNPEMLFSNRTVLLNTVIINVPYNREELFAARRFHFRGDMIRKRKAVVEEFVQSLPETEQDTEEHLACCLVDILRNSPLERSCLCSISSGSAVLFWEVEHFVLKNRLSKCVNENQLRGVLEYRLLVNERDSYQDACNREIRAIKSHIVAHGMSLVDLVTAGLSTLVRLLRREDFCQALSETVEGTYSVGLHYPIFGVTLKVLVQDILIRRDLLYAASHFMNLLFSGPPKSLKPTKTSKFTSLPSHILENIFSYLSNSDLRNFILFVSGLSPNVIDKLKSKWRLTLTQLLIADNESTSAYHP